MRWIHKVSGSVAVCGLLMAQVVSAAERKCKPGYGATSKSGWGDRSRWVPAGGAIAR